jgi:hypothetical protein
MNQDFEHIRNVLNCSFDKILLPVSSEFFNRNVFSTALLLAEKFQSGITLMYIIEEKTLDAADRLSDGYRTHYDIEQTKREMIRGSKNKAAKVVFSEARRIFNGKNIELTERIVRGEYSPMIKSELENNTYDLILMGYEKETMLNYRLFNEVAIPIWIEAGSQGDTILAVCSNLAPNQKVPIMGMYLSEVLDWPLQMLYVVDVEDTVQVDRNGQRSGPKTTTELTTHGNAFINKMKEKGLSVHLIKGGLEKETLKEATKIGARLVILGREHKKKQLLNPFSKGVKWKMAEHTRHSLLFIN